MFLWIILGLFFIFSVFSSKHYKILQQINVKMCIQYLAQGFEVTTFLLWFRSFNHQTRASAQVKCLTGLRNNLRSSEQISADYNGCVFSQKWQALKNIRGRDACQEECRFCRQRHYGNVVNVVVVISSSSSLHRRRYVTSLRRRRYVDVITSSSLRHVITSSSLHRIDFFNKPWIKSNATLIVNDIGRPFI